MSHSSTEYLRHILDETTYLEGKSHGLSKDEFLRDETIQRAFVRSLEVIGEATKIYRQKRERFAGQLRNFFAPSAVVSVLLANVRGTGASGHAAEHYTPVPHTERE